MRRKIDAVFLLFFVSGFSGLIYESVWSHYAKLFLGHAAYAQTLVLVVFIGGLALGAALCARFAQRLGNPLRIYAMAEAVIGLLALVFHGVFVATVDWSFTTLLPAACEPSNVFCPAQWVVTALLLAPQSVLLGATFPLVSSAVLRMSGENPGHDISALYFTNSFGAVLGVLASAFVLIPAAGLPGTLAVAGVLNLALAAVAFLLSRTAQPALVVAPLRADPVAPAVNADRLVKLLLATAFFTGLSSFIYEIAWIRMLSLVLGASTHSFELMLASFILGIALGGLWIRNRVDSLGDPVRFLAYVQLAMGVAAAATVAFYVGSFDFMAWLLSALVRNDGGFVFFNMSSTLIALLVMLPATFCAGMTLPLITYRLLHTGQGERALGTVYAVNTLGSIAGVILAVHLLLVWLGMHGALLFGAAIDVALGTFLLVAGVRPEARRAALRGPVPAALACLVIVAVAFPIDPRKSSSGVFRTGAARLAPTVNLPFHRDGKTATISVLEQDGLVAIRTNGKPDASLTIDMARSPTRDEFTMALLGVLPLGHKPDAKTAAVIGFGSGMSTAILLNSPLLERVDTVEIEPAMVTGAQYFRPVVDLAFTDPRSHIVIDDAKSYFARGRGRYDIIVSEPSNPWVSGVASLFTEEFYARLNGYLTDGGVLSQWLHTYEMDSQTLASIFAAVAKTFPEFVVYTTIDSDIVLVARKGGPAGDFDPAVMQLKGLQPTLAKLKLTDPQVVLRRKVASSQMLLPLFARYGMPANSDYYPLVEQRSSKTRFTQARVAELTDLAAAAIPIREMLGGAPMPSTKRHDVVPATLLDVAVEEAWAVREALIGGAGKDGAGPVVAPREFSARLVGQWIEGCSPNLTFDQVLPSLVSIAEVTVPFLHPEQGEPVWRRVRESRCGRALGAEQRHWLELIEAATRRDSVAMIATGTKILEGTRGMRNPASEFAFIATTTALLCRGEAPRARALLESAGQWMRPDIRISELRLLDSLARTPAAPTPCVAKAR